jgi:hypothetical protein
MDPQARLDDRREVRRQVAGIALSLVACLAAALWFLFSLFLWGFRCDENCGTGDLENWRWTGQLALAGLGGVLAVAALTLAVRSRTGVYGRALAGSAGCAFVWCVWVLGSGSF